MKISDHIFTQMSNQDDHRHERQCFRQLQCYSLMMSPKEILVGGSPIPGDTQRDRALVKPWEANNMR